MPALIAEPGRPIKVDRFRQVHVAALALVAIMLPWSEFLLSNAQFLLIGGWLIEGIRRRDLWLRLKQPFTTSTSAVFLSFFLLHVLGLAWTTDLGWGLDLCRILLPVLVFGVILGGSPRLSKGELRTVLLFGAWSAVASTLVCMVLKDQVIDMGEYRELSIFISHIRLALILCFSIVVLLHYARGSWWRRLLHGLAVAWCLFFLDRLSSLTGFAILGCLALLAAGRWSLRQRGPVRYATWSLLLVLVAATGAYAHWCVKAYYRMEPIDAARLDLRTAGGEYYFHDVSRPQHENGHAVWIYVADKELARGWSRRSSVSFDSTDAKGQPLRWTLIRYLASLGVRKDSVGLKALTPVDVQRIEQGVTDVEEGHRDPLRARIDEVLFELESYQRTGNASGHSVTMRLEFLRTGLQIARAHLWWGVGTGDTQQAFNAAYAGANSSLDPKWRLRAHNEYLTLLISFGVFGLAWSLFSWWWPAWRSRAFRDPLFLAWALIFLLSCFSEDTIETQMGATFFAFFYALFVFAAPRPDEAEAKASAIA